MRGVLRARRRPGRVAGRPGVPEACCPKRRPTVRKPMMLAGLRASIAIGCSRRRTKASFADTNARYLATCLATQALRPGPTGWHWMKSVPYLSSQDGSWRVQLEGFYRRGLCHVLQPGLVSQGESLRGLASATLAWPGDDRRETDGAAALVAARGDLPDLSPLLDGQQWRRDRKSVV